MSAWTRRDVLKAGVVAAAVGAGRSLARTRGAPSIVVIGAGLAGLTAAYRIHRTKGWTVTVLEASDRIGGRAYTVRGLPGGLYCEAGGTFVSTGDTSLRSLAKEVDVSLIDINPLWPGGGYSYYFNSKARTSRQVFRGETQTANAAERQFRRIPWQISHGEIDSDAVRFDDMTVAEWIERHVPDGAGTFRSYLSTYFETDYTGPVQEASALQMIADFAAPGRNYDERFLIEGGSDSLTTALASKLPKGAVRPGSPLVAVERRTHGYSVTIEEDGVTSDITADAIVLALPFPALNAVDLTRSDFSPLKRRAIRDLGMGSAMKVNLVFDSAAWRPQSSGDSVSDLATGWTWPGHVGQDAGKKLMVCMTGAAGMPDAMGAPAHGEAPPELASIYLNDLDKVFPGCSESYGGFTRVDRWNDDPWTGGSYSYYRAGTFTELAGVERRREGMAFFAGEHTARYGNRATMNGAVWSGECAARDVIAALGG